MRERARRRPPACTATPQLVERAAETASARCRERRATSIPCVSSRPRTTLASICDGVRKMTTRSGIGVTPPRVRSVGERLLDLDQDHRHVVVLIGVADERLDLAQDPLAQLAGLEVAVLLDDPAEPRLAEQIAARRSSPR